jgi:hypothetical protein
MSIEPSVITTGLDAARTKIANTIKSAASATGASFEYLVSAAKMESNLDPTAQASTSSARGLYQFIEQTWLRQICRRHYEVALRHLFGQRSGCPRRNPEITRRSCCERCHGRRADPVQQL